MAISCERGFSVGQRSVKQWLYGDKCSIHVKALQISRTEKISDFKGTVSWCARFMVRNDRTLRSNTKISQKLPNQHEKKITNFHRFLIRMRKEEGFKPCQIGTIDETPVWLHMPHSRTDRIGEKTVLVKTTGHEKNRFTVVLACMAGGSKLKPMVVFKRQTLPKGNFPGVILHCHP